MIQLIKFLSVGAIATCIQYLLLLFWVENDFYSPVIASSLSYSISAIFNYFANYYISFHSDELHSLAAIKFIVIAFMGLLINSALMWLCVDFFQIHYIVSQIAITGILLIWNFFLLKYWAYNSSKNIHK